LTLFQKNYYIHLREYKQSLDGSLRIAGNDKQGRIKIKTEDGKDIDLSYNKNQLAPGFPGDIPVYTPSEIKMSQAFQGGNAMASLVTGDAVKKVVQFYKDSLAEKGWTTGDEVTLTGMVLLQGKKDTGRLNISIREKNNKTTINLAMTESQ